MKIFYLRGQMKICILTDKFSTILYFSSEKNPVISPILAKKKNLWIMNNHHHLMYVSSSSTLKYLITYFTSKVGVQRSQILPIRRFLHRRFARTENIAIYNFMRKTCFWTVETSITDSAG